MLQQNPQSNIWLQLPAQPNPNPNNRLIQSVQIIEGLDPKAELRECIELKLGFGCIISLDEDKNLQPKELHPNKPFIVDVRQGEDTIRHKNPK